MTFSCKREPTSGTCLLLTWTSLLTVTKCYLSQGTILVTIVCDELLPHMNYLPKTIPHHYYSGFIGSNMCEEKRQTEAVFTQLQHGNIYVDTSSSGPDDLFEDDSYSPSSLSSSSSSSVHALVSLQGKPLCTSCGLEIVDRYLLKVNNLCWHVRCLSCSVCKASLGRHVSCYIKDKQVFCKLDYFRSYGTRCARCGRNIHSTDWVRRARGSTFHLACFSCSSCKRQLSTGEECGILENRVFCRPHYDILMDNIKRVKDNEPKAEEEEVADKDDPGTTSRPAKRARTSFTVDQLQVMQTQFAKDNNPDAQTLQKLSERTGLSRRVIQVWFQNCRARQKKHINPNPASSLTSLGPGHLTPPLMEDLQYTAYISQDPPLLTTLTYMDVQPPGPLLLQPIISNTMTQLPVSNI
ncbi:LIM/homeobox protein Lhx8-like isoform X2 [Betta splendens]|uniref:LIM/homeobox protein Lhx8-like isoform X2 n=1 Tax=Betta splendens TaxID=158456 RepID=A0A6P7L2K1_BETSP|nr:LIM/homeobox protein Lhx8-like isoform X2 [Betta splendens]